MTTLIIGKTGQLARALAQLDPGALCLDRSALDLSASAQMIEQTLDTLVETYPAIDGVIIAAAFTAVDQAEADQDMAFAVNADAPEVIATWCAKRNRSLIHISTDYVFNGQKTEPYQTSDPVDPINVYGASKQAGEVAVIATGANAAILRTSWVYDTASRNFMTTMLRLAETRDTLTVVGDQTGRPTLASDLAKAALIALKALRVDPTKSGIYHVSNAGDPVNWAEFAQAIFEAAGQAVTVQPIPASDYPTPAARPANSVLDISKFERSFRVKLPDWRDALDRAIAQRAATYS